MQSQNERTEMLLGSEAINTLAASWVAVFGVGGVGSFTVEGLARAGVGNFALFDDDKVVLSNINRQLIATRKTVGRKKVEVMRDRILEINPDANVECYPTFYTQENAKDYPLQRYSYVVDAIDTVSSKLTLIEEAKKANVPIMSSMGAGNKLDPTQFEVTDIYKTSVCPLAKVMRRELKRRGIKKLKVVYSKEEALTPFESNVDSSQDNSTCPPDTTRIVRRHTPGSVSFVPSVAGMIIAGEVIKDLTKEEREASRAKQAEQLAKQKQEQSQQ